MTLFELRAWLGRRSPRSTRYYGKSTPDSLAEACAEAGCFARSVRMVEVLLGRDAVTSGAVAAGERWRYYDLSHGLCSYSFFGRCRHRMACARCGFCASGESAIARLVEAGAGLRRMFVRVPLSGEERAAVDDGRSALDRLLGCLAEVAAPAGTAPGEFHAEPAGPCFWPAPASDRPVTA